MEKLSKADESRIMGALEQAVRLTNTGITPNDALYKVACDNKFTAPIVQRMVEAYNISKTHAHLKSASGPSRADTFPIADAVDILSQMYPTQIKSAAAERSEKVASDDYLYPPERNFMALRPELREPSFANKQAEAYPRDEVSRVRHIYNLKQRFEKNAQWTRETAERSYWTMQKLITKAGEHFRTLNHIPFAEVERKLVSTYGDMAKTAASLVYDRNNLAKRGEKRGSDFSPGRVIVMTNQEPYKSIVAIMDEAHRFNEASEKAAEAQIDLETFLTEHNMPVEKEGCTLVMEAASKESPWMLESVFNDEDRTKSAGIPGLGDLKDNLVDAGTTGMQMMGLAPKDNDSVVNKAKREVMDPVHESKINAIKTKAILNDLISNDPVLSSYEPHHVLHAYNQLQELSPAVGQQSMVLRGLLRRVMQQEGVMEPHEAQQITAIDRSLRGQPPMMPSSV